MATPRVYPLGRPVFWGALVVSLYAWVVSSGYAPVPNVLALLGVILGAAVQLADDRRWSVEQRIRQALMLSGFNINSVAIALFEDERRAPEVQRMLRGERPLDMARWEVALGKEFARHYATLTLMEYGAPDYIRKGIKIMPEGAL
jgi:hypothetical protein